MKKLIFWVAVALLAVIIIVQLLPYGRNHTNPAVIQEPNWDSPQTRQLAQRACFDCHSNETVWPWYSNIAPVSWLVQKDVDEARRYLNFSEWTGRIREADEISEVVAEGEMPPSKYLLMHSQARLSPSEQEALMRGLNASVR